MFRLARVLDLLEYRCRYPHLLFEREDYVKPDSKPPATLASSVYYTIKQMGSFYCADHLLQRGPCRMLEVGAGFNQYFPRRFGSEYEYWMVDQAGFYDQELFDKARKLRREHTFVNGLVGDFNPELPDGHFDVTFSISVLEHVPYGDIAKCAEDMFRITKPGGISVHSIDVTPETTKTRGVRWLESFQAAGFQIDPEISLVWSFETPPYEKELLLEPLQSVYESFGGAEARKFEKPVIRPYYFSTILAHCRRPA